MSALVAVLLVLAPALAIRWINDPELFYSRDLWLLAVLGLGAGVMVPTAPWFSCLALWFVWRWRGPDQLPSLVTWLGIGATWYLLRAMPAAAWEWIPWGWLLIGLWHVVVLAVQYDPELLPGRDDIDQTRRYRPAKAWLHRLTDSALSQRSARPWGLLGSAPTTAMLLALLIPFAPWYVLPFLIWGLWLTGSGVALSAASLGLCVSYSGPLSVLASAWLLGALYVLYGLRTEGNTRLSDQRTRGKRGSRLIDRLSPHGASLDGLRVRLYTHWLLWKTFSTTPWRDTVRGRGPWTIERYMKHKGFVLDLPVPEGGPFCEPWWMAWDYGVLGVLAMALLVLAVAPHLRWGDPWSACWLTGVVLSLGHFPMRLPQVGLVWLAASVKLTG